MAPGVALEVIPAHRARRTVEDLTQKADRFGPHPMSRLKTTFSL
jgi:hypothetical protein